MANNIIHKGANMFGVYFGKYLEGKGILTPEQYESILSDSKNNKVKI